MGSPRPGGDAVSGVIAFIGIGANMGNPAAACREALIRLGEIPGVRLMRASPLYRTEPVGPQEQAWFINAVAEIRTDLSPRMLFSALKETEQRMGRVAGTKWGPRVIDLDLLLYGQEVLREEGLVIPHPELHRRRFVLVPLAGLASYAIHPAFGVTVGGLLDRLTDESRVELYDECLGVEK
ncbi:MAG: 2-amino-4-hydroxy-6-hydroxymethyldihydropteridine diphosphokinase [Deltaproteobacteria bacterium]|nr:2-amino-4-hydroxy-6-hydroxymethyldihydropteridine diphosphokinase [Deltaproteobacteria bacterium]